MKSKITFLKKVAFICYLTIIVGFNCKVYSQIIYTDIEDATPNASCPLDLNNDTIDDFSLQFNPVGLLCIPLNSNAYSGNFVDDKYLAWALSQSTSICNSLTTWYDSNNPGVMAWGANVGYWGTATNKYLALKLIVDGNTYYGWARLDYVPNSFTLKDYAYRSIPNECIQAGETSLGINQNTNKNVFSIFPNPCVSSTTIKTLESLKNASLTIRNSIGQTVKQVNNISGQTVSLSRDNLANGLYYIELTEESKIIAKEKLLIKD